MPNNIGGARTRTFFKLTNRWRSYIFSVLFWGVFRVKEYIDPAPVKKIGVDVSFNLIRSMLSMQQHGFGSGDMPRSVSTTTNRVYILEIV